MFQELTITPSTIVLIVAIFACVVWAVRRMLKKGLCDCHDGCEGCSSKKKFRSKGPCSRCNAADSMVANIEKALESSDK